MNKLKNKVFFTIFSILTIFVTSVILVYNIQGYVKNKNMIIENLGVATNIRKHTENPMDKGKYDDKFSPDKGGMENGFDENVKFMDATIYTILINEDKDILDVINRSSNSLTDEEITSLAESILDKMTSSKKHVGFLYFDKYSYNFIEGSSLVILDNSKISHSLLLSLEISIIMLVLLEIAIYFISKIITNWITVPVKESFDKQKRFIADASHELKTPLSVILASSEVFEDNPKEMKWIKNIKSEAERMNMLVTELLELSKAEEENKLGLELGDLSKAVELSALTFEGRTFESDLKLDCNIEDNIKIKMNENSIKQLVEILLDNAIKHSKQKETINIILKNNDNNVELLVQNEGEPIPNGEEEKIFERFYRIDKARNRKENRYGLGLAIAKSIVETHSGKISASSEDGTTTFKVLFKK